MNVPNKKDAQYHRWALEPISNSSEKWMVVIEPVPFTIGRDEECNLALDSKWISRHHAQIRSSGGMLWVYDLGSTNGTFVNHKPINKSELLEAGDIVSIGRSDFSVKSISAIRPDNFEATIAFSLTEEFTNLPWVEQELRRLLRDQDVAAHFQPILRFSDMDVVGYEVLGRLSEGNLPLNITELFHVAETLGYAVELSSLFRNAGVESGSRLPGSPLFFVNTYPGELDRMDRLIRSLEKTREISPSTRIVLEISEQAMPDAHDMKKLRISMDSLDIGIAFDDFGVGQVRLVELAKAPPDYLKFDMSLIRDIHLAPQRLHQMVLTFVRAAKDLGIATLAEGIQCIEEGETCRQLGFEYTQGFLYGRPAPIDEILTPKENLEHNTDNS